jgi:uncharacterized protein YndB with AHSA1/START domain
MVGRQRPGDEAVRKATGKSWEDWFKLLEEAGLQKTPHKDIVTWLYERNLGGSGWWRQSITVEYEFHVGRRKPGETSGAGFQVGVSKTIEAQPDKLWHTLFSASGLKVWLGDTELLPEAGYRYRTEKGTSGQVRSVDEPKRLRLTWQPEGYHASTLQIYLTPSGPGKTVLLFHHEKLADSAAREAMRKHWQDVLSELQKLV